MIVYNVTISVNPDIEEEFIQWLTETHIPEVLETDLFISANVFRVIEDLETKSHNSFAVQYSLESWLKLEEYQSKYASALQQKTRERYGDNVLAFRTFLEKYQ